MKMKKPLKVFASLGMAASILLSMPGLQASASSQQGVVEVKADSLYVRSDNSFNSKTIRILHKGETLKVYGESNGMYKLGDNQWTSANAKYVKYTPTTSTTNVKVNSAKANSVTVKVKELNIRSGASFTSKVVGVAYKGNSYTILEEKNGLYRIGVNRWISAGTAYVTATNKTATTTATTPQTSVATSGKIQIKTTSLNIRSGASFTSKVVGVATKGQVFTVYEKKNGLYRIGENRWVSAGAAYVTTTVAQSASAQTSTTNQATTTTQTSSKAQALINYGKKYMGMKYVWASSNPSYGGFDCSGFIYWVYKNNGYNIPRSNVAGYWSMVKKTTTPKAGDIVFFKNTYKAGPSHIGIYLGDGKFLNANSEKGIAIDNVNSSYWKSHFLGYGSF